ncbi:hypothetical protein ACT3XG_01320 [Paenibacillus polymyxa]|uniref:hypothetical protein n=1 Tax=Paenibacillus TaxID=44249 RepID=UPI00057F7FBD|nr:MULTISPECIES: hypothetical protein [Paenibacillus]AIY09680.1 hypothetical protein LK13_14305 [Paenibacillus polymyxa]KAF6654914.1 hypothetical protein HFD99_17570 [Paenibacillus sp. EKM301P]RPE11213.1 hypothetical protein EG487_01265 [Paenibacillus polymyxa]UBS87574.1 hypothetical protein LAZ93_01350 [Paenibacillus polymyxa]WHX36159.1 hypothetical protein QNH38_01340 [Paenibacillus polymyxa]
MTESTKRVRISQWDALMLESLRSLGWSPEELIRRVQQNELPTDGQFDYAELATGLAANEPEVFVSAVTDGYQIKYNTIRGIRTWIAVALGGEPELSLEEGSEAITSELTQAEYDRLEQVLSLGWVIQEVRPATGDTAGLYRIVPAAQIKS